MTPTDLRPDREHAEYLDHDWRIAHANGMLFDLEFREPARLQWHTMFRALTEQECRAAYDAYQDGEKPEGNEVWP